MDDATARTRSGWGSSRETYMTELCFERRYGIPYPQGAWTQSAAVLWGNEQEANAITTYEMTRNVDVVQVGFMEHPRIPMSGASPDGLVGKEGLVEVKCPDTKRHFALFRGAAIDSDYIKQMQWQLCVTGRQWCDFVSYDPRIPEDHQEERIVIRRIMRDDKMIASLEADTVQFLKELGEMELEMDNAKARLAA
jgi:predicted phage-related endonuclease